MNQIASILGPWMINLWLLFIYTSDNQSDKVTHYVTSTESRKMLTIQWYLQCIQFVCFWIFTKTDWSGFYEQVEGPDKYLGLISYIAFVVTLVIVPIASVAHWFVAFNSEDSKNRIITWLSIYPMMSLMNCLFLLTVTENKYLYKRINLWMAVNSDLRHERLAQYDAETICEETKRSNLARAPFEEA